MGTAIIKIPYVVLREQPGGSYRPRFVPSPELRRQGFKGRDLKTEAGTWFGVEAARDWSRSLVSELAGRKQAKAAGARVAAPAGPAIYTVAELFEDLFRTPAFQLAGAGRPGVKRKAPKTVSWYRQMVKALRTFDPDVMAAPAAWLSPKRITNLFRALAEAKGLHTARGVLAVMSSALTEAILQERGGLKHNPALRLKLGTPAPRIRVGEIFEMRAFIVAADVFGRPEIGDSVYLGLFTGQRQGDRLALVGGRLVEGRLFFRQGKTGAVVLIPPAPALLARLEAARQRRQAATVQYGEVVINELAGAPFAADWYRHLFGQVRDAAVYGIWEGHNGQRLDVGPGKDQVAPARAAEMVAEGVAICRLEPCPSLAGFRDQDLRDTSVTWLANAGCTVPEICAITGHSERSAYEILRHYLGRHPDQADAAIGKLVRWVDGKGGL